MGLPVYDVLRTCSAVKRAVDGEDADHMSLRTQYTTTFTAEDRDKVGKYAQNGAQKHLKQLKLSKSIVCDVSSTSVYKHTITNSCLSGKRAIIWFQLNY